jgi:hypothetical protein
LKTLNNNTLISSLYNSHSNTIINRKNKEYLKLFEHYNDLISNIEDEDLKNRIMYSHIRIEEFLFNSMISTSKKFYELAFNDLKALIFTEQKIDN